MARPILQVLTNDACERDMCVCGLGRSRGQHRVTCDSAMRHRYVAAPTGWRARCSFRLPAALPLVPRRRCAASNCKPARRQALAGDDEEHSPRIGGIWQTPSTENTSSRRHRANEPSISRFLSGRVAGDPPAPRLGAAAQFLEPESPCTVAIESRTPQRRRRCRPPHSRPCRARPRRETCFRTADRARRHRPHLR